MPISSWHSSLVVINPTILWGAFHDHFVPHCWEGSFPVLKMVLVDKTLNVLLLGYVLIVKTSLDTCILVMVQESIPSHCIFSYLELHYYSHWSYIKLYIWSTASSLVIIFVGGSVIHLVIQEIIILWNKQNTGMLILQHLQSVRCSLQLIQKNVKPCFTNKAGSR